MQLICEGIRYTRLCMVVVPTHLFHSTACVCIPTHTHHIHSNRRSCPSRRSPPSIIKLLAHQNRWNWWFLYLKMHGLEVRFWGHHYGKSLCIAHTQCTFIRKNMVHIIRETLVPQCRKYKFNYWAMYIAPMTGVDKIYTSDHPSNNASYVPINNRMTDMPLKCRYLLRSHSSNYPTAVETKAGYWKQTGHNPSSRGDTTHIPVTSLIYIMKEEFLTLPSCLYHSHPKVQNTEENR